MQTLQTVWKGATVSLVCLILLTVNVSAWDTSDMDAKMDSMQAEMDATFAAKFGAADSGSDSTDDTSDTNDDTSDSDATFGDWNPDDDSTTDLDQEMDDMQQEMDAKFAFFGSSDADDDASDDTGDDQNTVDDGNDGTNDDTTDDSDAGWNHDDSTDDSSSDDSSDDTTDDDSADGPSGQPSSLEEATEQKLHELINNERRQRGLTPFDWDGTLAQTADYKSQDMADRSYFAHTSPTGDSFRDIYNRFGYNCRIPYSGTIYLGGENIARTWFDRSVRTDTGSTVHYDSADELANGLRRQWMTSDPHRKAILRPYYANHGLGVEITSDGRVYATEHFC